LLWSCSFVVSSFGIDAALKMVTTRSQIAERRAKFVPHTNAQQQKKKMKKNATEKKTEKKMDNKKMKKNATEKKTEKKTDNKDNKTDNPKDWGDFVEIQQFFLRKNSLFCGVTKKYVSMA
jgi:sRNA-binding protein